MKRNELWLITAAMVLLAAFSLIWYGQPLRPASGAAGGDVGQTRTGTEAAGAKFDQRTESVRPPFGRILAGNAGAPTPQTVRVRADEVLATVNGTNVTLKDLTPVKPESRLEERTMGLDMYQMLLKRAVERELAFQFAQARGVTLTDAQQRSLMSLRARSEQQEPGVFDNLGRSAVNTEFEQRDLTGLMLLNNLAAQAGLPSPYVTPEQVEQYFVEHSKDYPPIPDDPPKRQEALNFINADIRNRLAPMVKAEHEEQLRGFIDQLSLLASLHIGGGG